jgi:hypothetical protein
MIGIDEGTFVFDTTTQNAHEGLKSYKHLKELLNEIKSLNRAHNLAINGLGIGSPQKIDSKALTCCYKLTDIYAVDLQQTVKNSPMSTVVNSKKFDFLVSRLLRQDFYFHKSVEDELLLLYQVAPLLNRISAEECQEMVAIVDDGKPGGEYDIRKELKIVADTVLATKNNFYHLKDDKRCLLSKLPNEILNLIYPQDRGPKTKQQPCIVM